MVDHEAELARLRAENKRLKEDISGMKVWAKFMYFKEYLPPGQL